MTAEDSWVLPLKAQHVRIQPNERAHGRSGEGSCEGMNLRDKGYRTDGDRAIWNGICSQATEKTERVQRWMDGEWTQRETEVPSTETGTAVSRRLLTFCDGRIGRARTGHMLYQFTKKVDAEHSKTCIKFFFNFLKKK